MLESIAQLQAVLNGTPLANCNIALVPPAPGSDGIVFAIDVSDIDAIEAWSLLRSLTDRTGRWPLLSMMHTSRADAWERQVSEADLFSRFYFQEEQRNDRLSDSPADIIAASAGIHVAEQLARFPADASLELTDALETARQETLRQYGTAPAIADPAAFLTHESIATCKQLERWFLRWEIENCADPLSIPEYGLAHIDWYFPKHESHALLLMPSLRGWEAPAYLNWYASSLCNSQFIVALLREWHEQYGAELVAHYGTMLQFMVSRRPATIEQAFELAWQQHTVSPCTLILPGVSMRNHARALLHTDRWFLHERP